MYLSMGLQDSGALATGAWAGCRRDRQKGGWRWRPSVTFSATHPRTKLLPRKWVAESLTRPLFDVSTTTTTTTPILIHINVGLPSKPAATELQVSRGVVFWGLFQGLLGSLTHNRTHAKNVSGRNWEWEVGCGQNEDLGSEERFGVKWKNGGY